MNTHFVNLTIQVVTQNIDGMHMRSGLDRSRLAELHGNMFVDQCTACKKQFARGSAAETVGQKVSDVGCPAKRANRRACRYYVQAMPNPNAFSM